MNNNVYSIKDELTGFSNPLIMMNDDEAIRTLNILVNDKESMVGQSPLDYSIYRIGNFNTVTGKIEAEEPTLIIRANALKRGEDNEVCE